METDSDRQRTHRVEQRAVQVVYEITPGDSCVLNARDEDLEVVDVRTQSGADGADCEMTIRARNVRDGRYMITHNHCDGPACPCQAFAAFDAIPTVRSVDDGKMTIETYLDSRENLSDLTAMLRERAEAVVVLRIKQNDVGRLPHELSDVDLSTLTDKQHRALETAIEMGYYDSTTDVTLADLAAQFDISRQAFSQRLSAAEKKVMDQLSL